MVISIISFLILALFCVIYSMTNNEFSENIIPLLLIIFILNLVVEGKFEYEKYRGIDVIVKDNDEILYQGNSAFYDIKSMGTATYFVEKEQKAWFPRVVNERVSNNIKVIKK